MILNNKQIQALRHDTNVRLAWSVSIAEGITLGDLVTTLRAYGECLDQALNLIEERKHYVSPTPDSERPSFRTIEGCAGDAFEVWKNILAKGNRRA